MYAVSLNHSEGEEKGEGERETERESDYCVAGYPSVT